MKLLLIIGLILIQPRALLYAQSETTTSGGAYNVSNPLPQKVTQGTGLQCGKRAEFFSGNRYTIDHVFQEIERRNPQVIAFGEEHGNHETEAYEFYLDNLKKVEVKIDCWLFEMDFQVETLTLNNRKYLTYQQLVDQYYNGDDSVIDEIPDGLHEIIKKTLPLLKARGIRPIGIDSLSIPYTDSNSWLNARDVHMHRKVMNLIRPSDGTNPTCSRAVLTIGASHLFRQDAGRISLREKIERSGITMSNNVILTAGATNNNPTFAKPHGILGPIGATGKDSLISAKSGGWDFKVKDLVCPQIVRPTTVPYGLRAGSSVPLIFDSENNKFWGDFSDFDNAIVYSCQRDQNCTRLNQLLERHSRSTGIGFY